MGGLSLGFAHCRMSHKWLRCLAVAVAFASVAAAACQSAPAASGVDAQAVAQSANNAVAASASPTSTRTPTPTVAPILISDLQPATPAAMVKRQDGTPSAEPANTPIADADVMDIRRGAATATRAPTAFAAATPSPASVPVLPAPTATAMPVIMPTLAPSPSHTPASMPALMPTTMPTHTVTPTPELKAMEAPTPTPVATQTPAPTQTLTPASTTTPLPTSTPVPAYTPTLPPTPTPVPADCRIKGNISGDERVYHTPDSPWYNRTEIDASKGERWFCSAQEAEDAGWRAPKRTPPKPSSTPAPDSAPKPCESRVNINTASAEELETLPGIGPVLAQRIVDYRSANGNFASVEQLVDVHGIAEKILEKIKPCVVL